MFSFRRKPTKKEDDPQIYASPSLPTLSPQGIPWPENLVDVTSIRQESSPEKSHLQGATKTSFSSINRPHISFHKPFHGSPGKTVNGISISSLYMSNAPSAFESWKSTHPTPARKNQRRVRVPPTFNLMVVGGEGTGKTSLLRLLLETADISPTATDDQRAAMDRFLHGSTKHTQSIQTACVEICESKFDRVLFSVIDTPGLDFLEGRELKLERQVSGIIKYLDTQYADTMSEESKVVRQSKGDQHIHLCIYMVDPAAVLSVATRRAQSTLPNKTRSEATISYRDHPPDLVPDNGSADSDDESAIPLRMSPAEIRVIRRLSARTNVLPVIARADSLTDERLAAVKEAVRKGLQEAGLGFGVFDPAPKTEDTHKAAGANGHSQEKGNGDVNGHIEEDDSDEENDHELSDDRQARPVIKLRPARHRTRSNLSRSRSRRELAGAGVSPDPTDRESVANVRFHAHIIAKTDLTALLPFALIAPEDVGKLRKRPMSSAPSSPVPDASEDGHTGSFPDPSQSPSQASNRNMAYLVGPPDDLKGIFTRKFRWGTVDVLDPNHCDFAALRTAVLSTHLKILKTHTKEVLYEKYRTEKLLARRATANINEEERKRLLEDLGL